ncbi:hypothetical protein [Actinomadura kijaniata]|uniref:hypothetical protein n=1 Tax=Actinomadura kijaniata TaxID=46161 RepID=UPI0012FB81E1|nr:hypothetical protein [Actinomadura kijaniata]
MAGDTVLEHFNALVGGLPRALVPALVGCAPLPCPKFPLFNVVGVRALRQAGRPGPGGRPRGGGGGRAGAGRPLISGPAAR